jgi:hypothetical protein
MPLRRMIRNFTDPVDARTAADLTRQLADFEDNVAAECDSIRQTAMPALSSVAKAARSSSLQVGPGQSAGFDTSSGDVSVTLDLPSAKHDGKLVAIYKRSAANALEVRMPSGVTINGAASFTLTAAGLLLIFCDGEGYWA